LWGGGGGKNRGGGCSGPGWGGVFFKFFFYFFIIGGVVTEPAPALRKKKKKKKADSIRELPDTRKDLRVKRNVMWVEQLLVFMSGDFNSDAGVGNRAIRYTRCSLMDRPGSEQMNSNKKPVRTTTIRSTYRSHKQLTVLCSSTNYPSLVSERLWTYEGESTSSRCG